VLTTMADGSTIEVGMVGMEGMVGVSALLGGEISAQQVIMQIAGSALRMNASLCKAVFDESEAVRGVTLRFTEALLNLGAQTAACNRLHSVEQRCARWLLMSSDRTQSDMLPLTQEFLSSMLGVRGHRSGRRAAALRADPLSSRADHDLRSRRPGGDGLRMLPARSRSFRPAATDDAWPLG
jgi:CRP-like cAMP-binding protein